MMPIRHYQAAVSAEALALAWARQEQAPSGATVVVDNEVSPRGHAGRLWGVPAADTLSMAVVLRPEFSVEDADAAWLVAGLLACTSCAAASARSVKTWWPDRVVDGEDGAELAMTKAEVQLGPGRMRFAVVTFRLDLRRLGVAREALIEAMDDARNEHSSAIDDAELVGGWYSERCALLHRKVRLSLLPKGECRGRVSGVDRSARLQIESSTGMVERIGIHSVRNLEVRAS
jgi:biotin-(acetyl-CoA carboxylase) ligase